MNLLPNVRRQLLHLCIGEVEFPELSQLHDPITQLPQGVVAQVQVEEDVALLDGIRKGGQS